MANKTLQVGYWWYVYEQVFADTTDFQSDDTYTDENGLIRYDKSPEDAWETVRVKYGLSKKKKWDSYRHGEVVYDTNKCKFKAYGPEKLIDYSGFKNKIIAKFGLSTFTLFEPNN